MSQNGGPHKRVERFEALSPECRFQLGNTRQRRGLKLPLELG